MKFVLLVMLAAGSAAVQAKGFSKNFVFRYQAAIPASYSRGDIQWSAAVCDRPTNLANAQAGARCALIGIYKHITISAFRIIVTRTGSQHAVLSDLSENFTAPWSNLSNIFRYVDAGQPLYVRQDLRDGTLYVGVDSKNLIEWGRYY